MTFKVNEFTHLFFYYLSRKVKEVSDKQSMYPVIYCKSPNNALHGQLAEGKNTIKMWHEPVQLRHVECFHAQKERNWSVKTSSRREDLVYIKVMSHTVLKCISQI